MTGPAGAQAEFDDIVVGSGAGGGPLAANLARAGRRVLLLEAGGDHHGWNYQVPVFHAISTEDPAMSWAYFVRHYEDPALQQRDPKFVKDRDGVFYPRAGTLGGCTAHNAMITVYPHNSDWDRIAEVTGDRSWRSDAMRVYFERLEQCRYRPLRRWIRRLLGLDPSRHGFAGWLTTEAADPRLILRDFELLKLLKKSALGALRELGTPLARLESAFKTVLDPNDWRLVRRSAEGVRFTPLATDGGRCRGTREYLLETARAHPDRLTIRTHALVSRVLLDGENRAIGVEHLEGPHLYRADPRAERSAPPPAATALARREVILAAGAFNSPQILKLSGIGPRAELERHGVPVRVELPGVGENLQDRYEVGVVLRMKKDFALLEGATFRGPGQGQEPDPHFKEWQRGTGIYTTNGAVIGIIKRSRKERPDPDLFIFGLAGRFQGYFPGYSSRYIGDKDYFTWAILKGHTNNTSGRVLLRTADPRDTPRINFRYFGEGNDASGDDLDSVVEGVEFVRRLNRGASHVIEREEVPGPAVATREHLREFIRDEAWGHHASCSNKMGPRSDPAAVVGSDFRVHGTKNLRIVDASLFPRIPGLFIVSAVYMISEKATDAILGAPGGG